MSSATTAGEASGSAGRQRIHTRRVECTGYLRRDGLWDIEGRLDDSKTHAVLLSEGRTVEAGQTYHGMTVCLTLDDTFTIQAVAVTMSDVPTSECRGAAPNYAQLVGLRIGPGFTRTVKTLFGRTGGCTHLTELTQVLPTAGDRARDHRRVQIA